MVVKTASFPGWKESHTLLASREDSMPSSKVVSQTRRKPKLLFLDLSLCCCRNMSSSVDSPLSEKQLLGGRDSRWVVTEVAADGSKDGNGTKDRREGTGARDVLFSGSASARDSSTEESWFAQTFRRSRKHQGQGFGGNNEQRPAHAKKPSWDGSSVIKSQTKTEPVAQARALGAASWWGENPAEKRQQQAISVKDSSSFRTYSRSGSALSRSSSTKKRTHEMIYSGNAKWKKILRRVLNEARKIHLPAVTIDGPYNYDMLDYMKNFDVNPDDDYKPMRFRSLGSASGYHLQAALNAQLDSVQSDDESEILQASSPARKASRSGSLSPIHLKQ